jgi:hypothetical protein
MRKKNGETRTMESMFRLAVPSGRRFELFVFIVLATAQAPCARSWWPPSKAPDSVRLARELWLAPDASMRVVQSPAKAPVISEAQESAQFTDGGVEVSLDVWMPLRELPEILRPHTAETPEPAAPQPIVLEPPHTFELDYRIHSPAGFVPDKLPEGEELKIGPALYSVSYKAEPDTTIKATVKFQVGKTNYTREDVLAFREAYLKNGNALEPVVRFVPAAGATATGSGRRFEDLEGATKLTDLSQPEFDAACGWTNQLAKARLPAEGTVIECEGQKVPFSWPNRCAIGGGRPKSGCAVTVAQTRQCMPAVVDLIKRDPCAFFVASSLGESTDLLAKVPECKGAAACMFSP